jgi:PAS domain S-box-containing protein
VETTTQRIYDANKRIASLQTTSRDISDRMEVLQELRKKEQEFRTLAENAPSIIQRLDRDLKYTYSNKIFSQLFGKEVASIMGRSVAELLPEGPDKEKFIRTCQKVFRLKNIETLRLHLVRKDETEWDFLCTIAPELNGAGEVESILVISSNITDLQQKEELLQTKERELLHSNERFELATKATTDSIWEVNLETGYLFTSPEFTERFGYSNRDMGGLSQQWFTERIHPEDRLSVVSRITQNFAGREKIWKDEFRWRTREGVYKFIRNQAYIFYNAEGKPFRAIGAIQDITDRKLAESQLIQKDILLSASAQAANELLNQEGFDEAVRKSLQIIGVATKVNRTYIFQFHFNEARQEYYYRQIQAWNSGAYQQPSTSRDLQYIRAADFPEIFSELSKGNPNQMITRQQSGEALRLHLQDQDIRSLLQVPIMVGNHFWGFVGFDQCDYERNWTQIELDILKAFASNLAGVIQRRDSDRKLKESEIKFKSLFENSLDIVNVLNSKFEIQFVTPSIRTVLGYEEQDLIGRQIFEFIHPEDQDRIMRSLAELRKSPDQSLVADLRIRNKSGAWIWMEWKGINRLEDPIIRGQIISFRDISERKQSEQQLQGYSEHITNILNSITDGFIAMDYNFRVLWWNPIAAEMTGIRDVDILGKNLWEALPILKRTKALAEYQKAISYKKMSNFELYIEENKTYYDVNAYPSQQGIFVYFKDITGKKKREMLLQLEKEVLELNANPAASLKNTVDYFLEGIEKLNEGILCSVLTLDDFNMTAKHLSGPSLAVGYTQAINGLKIGPHAGSCGTAMYYQKMVVVSDIQNDPLWEDYRDLASEYGLAACWSFPVLTANNQVLGTLATYYKKVQSPTQDQIELLSRAASLLGIIMENKQAEEKINISNERYLLATKASNDAIWDYDIKRKQLYWGESFYSLFHYTAEHQINLDGFWESKIHPDERARVEKVFEEAINRQEKGIVYCEYRFQRGDGKYSLVVDRAFIVYDGDGQPARLVGSMQDITERKALERKLLRQEVNKQKIIAQAVVDAQEKERAEIGKELHDNVNQILSTAKLYLELAKTDHKQKEELIKRSADSIFHAINEIRHISRALVPPSVKDLGLIDSIRDLVESLKMTKVLQVKFTHKGNFEKEVDDKQKLMLFRIIQEQVNNVLKHAEATKLVIDISIDDRTISLSVADNGKGFDKGKVRVKKGVGLGNIESRTHLFNGKVVIDTEPGKGCKLFVQIPILHH